MKVYLDNAATTKILDEFKEELLNIYTTYFANASSLHSPGKKTRYMLEKSREVIAKDLNVLTNDIFFTSGATESNNMILKGVALSKGKGHIITSSIEHLSILNVCKYLEEKGFTLSYIKPNNKGIIETKEIEKNLREDTILVTVMAVNNETGVRMPIEEIGNMLKEKNIFFHSDMTQLILREKLDLALFNVDAISASFHKFHGAKGSGFAYISSKHSIEKYIHGGHQEKNRRAGTENVHSIIFSAKVYEYLSNNIENNIKYIKNLRDYLIQNLEKFGDKIILNNSENTIPHIINIQIKDEDIEYLLPLFDMRGIFLSGGSACQSGAMKASNVLMEQGLSEKEAKSSIRISLSIQNKKEEIDYFIKVLDDIIK
ncbi:cysteine desulfurase family protein [Streptobacillus moniliformis]|uniref:cysteine desulfurase family protein n=1 Tax=Streptobacillus moniliformis TaxID=34105 RepID=UPI0007E364FE|nr:cysteine desulfurase family protein [Streptobacillus moniliformis]